MKEEEIKRIALEKYPIDEFWVGDSATGRLYDENKRDRIVFERGLRESNDYHQQKTKELIEWVENEIKEHEKWDMEDHAYAYKQVLTKLKEELN
jgi:hypothetical protein